MLQVEIRPSIKPESTEIRQNWFDTYLRANTEHPLRMYGIFTLVGRDIMQSLREGSVDLGHVNKSQPTAEQFTDLRETMTKMHRAHGVKKAPNEHAKDGEKKFDSDEWLKNVWAITRASVIKSLVYHATDTMTYSGENARIMKMRGDGLAHSLSRSSAEEMNDDIEAFTKSSEYERVFPIVEGFYDADVAALRTDEAKIVAGERRNALNRRKSQDLGNARGAEWYENYLVRLMKDEIIRSNPQVEEGHVDTFLSVITTIPVNNIEDLQDAEFYRDSVKLDAALSRA